MQTIKLKNSEQVFTNVMTLQEVKSLLKIENVYPKVSTLKEDGKILKKGEKTAFLILGESGEALPMSRNLINKIEDKTIVNEQLFIGDLENGTTIVFSKSETIAM